MRVFEHSFEAPGENLALDEVLLEDAEAGIGGECLRFWESPVPFVVLGLTQPVADHVLIDACARDGVSIQRRCTAGGCVLQGPGCLNFAFVLRTDREGCGTIHSSYRSILGWIARALPSASGPIRMAGISDLAVGELKFSGNAQKRKRHYFLHHGTILYAFDPGICGIYLKEPEDRPEYRSGRRHEDFIANIGVERATILSSVSEVFREFHRSGLSSNEEKAVQWLAREKYGTHEWVNKR